MEASPSKLKRRASDSDEGEQPEPLRSEQKNSPTSSHPPSIALPDPPDPETLHRDRHTPLCDQFPARSRSGLSPDDGGQAIRSNEDQEMLDFPVRMPTPIHGSFFLTSSHHNNGDVAMGGIRDNACLLGHPQYHGRPLPSPISEGEDKPQRFELNGEPMEIVEDNQNETPAARGGATANDKTSRNGRSSQLVDGRIPPAAVPGKGKLVISMGYRADCEKCRDMVPGHYSHFIRV
ncbi:hypothetical protein FGG08_002779 [Glutinoglossum americanum]|uniref:Uncharacterized protein n=1 Tax=Glutinoglossum americanum TaxID=1670608 RepID=A0A9P8I8J2_9PEZI|nr:hypothetical protein FGG08_002779 [Glutinoglossum americanum]